MRSVLGCVAVWPHLAVTTTLYHDSDTYVHTTAGTHCTQQYSKYHRRYNHTNSTPQKFTSYHISCATTTSCTSTMLHIPLICVSVIWHTRLSYKLYNALVNPALKRHRNVICINFMLNFRYFHAEFFQLPIFRYCRQFFTPFAVFTSYNSRKADNTWQAIHS